MLKYLKSRSTQLKLGLMVAFILVVIAIPMTGAMAQTPVPFSIDTSLLTSNVNMWTASLDDIIFYGTSIAIAVGILLFVSYQVLKAFSSVAGGRR